MASKAYHRDYYKKHRTEILKTRAEAYASDKETYRNRSLKREHGMSGEEYDRKNAAQSGLCMICNQPCPTGRRLAVDHDHVTGQNRDLLCIRCNRALGLLRDSVNIMRSALQYLERWKG